MVQQPGSIGSLVPPTSEMEALRRRVSDLERRLTETTTARSGQAMVISALPGMLLQNGAPLTVQDGGTVELDDASTLNINDGGGLYLRTPAGTIVMRADRVDIPDGSGRKQQAFAVYRDDGTVVFIVADLGTVPGHPHGQNWGMYDHDGNIVLAEDIISGQGLAWPLLSMGAFMSNGYPTDTTTSGSFVTLQVMPTFKQQPRVFIQILGRSDDSSTTGEIRVIDQAGNVVGPVQTVAAGAYTYYSIGPTAVLGTHGQAISLNVQARRTAGTGSIGVRGICAIGQPS